MSTLKFSDYLVGLDPGSTEINENAVGFANVIANSDGSDFDALQLAITNQYVTKRANGEVFYGPSGEVFYGQSNNVIETSQTVSGASISVGATPFIAFKFITSSLVSFIQGLSVRVKKTGAMNQTSRCNFSLYTDSGGSPGVQLSSSGNLYAPQILQTGIFEERSVVFQNIAVNLIPNTTYWAVIQKVENGGEFIFDGTPGSGNTYSGNNLGALSDTGDAIWFKVFARSYYGVHTYAANSHALWGVSVNAVGVRGDSTSHYGVFGLSVSDVGVRGGSTYSYGAEGRSTYSNGVNGQTQFGKGVSGSSTATIAGYAGVSGSSSYSVVAQAIGVESLQAMKFNGAPVFSAMAGSPTGVTAVKNETYWNTSPAVAGGAAFWRCVVAGTPGTYGIVHMDGISADQGDTSPTLTWGAIESTVVFSTTLTTNRTITLAGGVKGAKLRITRSAAGAFTLDVGGLKSLAASQWCDVQYNGTVWGLTAFGSL